MSSRTFFLVVVGVLLIATGSNAQGWIKEGDNSSTSSLSTVGSRALAFYGPGATLTLQTHECRVVRFTVFGNVGTLLGQLEACQDSAGTVCSSIVAGINGTSVFGGVIEPGALFTRFNPTTCTGCSGTIRATCGK